MIDNKKENVLFQQKVIRSSVAKEKKMQISFLLLEKIIELFIMIFMGFVLVKSHLLKAQESKSLSTVALYLIMPCVILDVFQVEYTPGIIKGLFLAFVAAILVHIIFAVLIVIFGRIFKLNVVEKASIMYPNAGNLIIPIVTSVLGKEWVIYSSAFITVQLILLWTHGKFMLSDNKKFEMKQIFTNINMIAIMIGVLLFLTRIKLPILLGNAISSVGGMIAPISMFITGMLIANTNLKKFLLNRRIYFIMFLRMIIFPLIIIAFLQLSDITDFAKDGKTIILITFLAIIAPSASTITQMSQLYGKDAEYASVINVISTLMCIITMPIMVGLYGVLIN